MNDFNLKVKTNRGIKKKEAKRKGRLPPEAGSNDRSVHVSRIMPHQKPLIHSCHSYQFQGS